MLAKGHGVVPWSTCSGAGPDLVQFNKKTAFLTTAAASLLAVAGPILLALWIAAQQSADTQTQRVVEFARDTLHRSDSAADQFYSAVKRISSMDVTGHCGPEDIAIMREIDLASSYIQAVGRVSDNSLLCSSLGDESAVRFDLGEPEVVTGTGTSVRSAVRFPFTRNVVFTVLERDGVAAVIHKDLPVDVSTEIEDLSLATVTPDNLNVRSSHGPYRAEWAEALGDRQRIAFIDETHVVAVERSVRYATIAVAALPLRHIHNQTVDAALLLVPAGLVGSAILIWAILYTVRLQLALPAVLKVALRQREFFLVYQPVVDLQTGRWRGVEALLRWQRQSGEFVRPDIFIPAAEDLGLIQRVTMEVCRLVSRDARAIFAAAPDFHIGINLAAADLHDIATVDLVGGLAAETGAASGNLMIEATERGFMDADRAREVVRLVREKGVEVAIDDFGTGYSSLSYLESFDLDYLKIDKSFVDNIGTDSAGSHVVEHIIEMSKSLNLEMIAEGVETEAQAEFLRARGVQFAQGWLYSKPLRLNELVSAIKQHDAA